MTILSLFRRTETKTVYRVPTSTRKHVDCGPNNEIHTLLAKELNLVGKLNSRKNWKILGS